MDNNENNNNNEYSNEEEANQPRKYDPAGETKSKLIFFAVLIVIMVAVKYIFGF